ncbi:MAG: twin-arginine translocase subunit TatB, partial [Planctomycetales bacterium]|nr:twin-arginine translocase subunit TatB [Planctomycetales bacterium]
MDSFFGIGPMELFVIAVLALIVLGPERLPGAVREVAKQLRALRSISNEFTSQFSEELQALDELNPNKILRDL